jgi:hypothetical protein
MQSRTLLIVALLALSSGCYLFFGPPRSRIQGWVHSADDQTPLPRAEVCVFGLDTTCIRADANGRYSISLPEQSVWIRFRYGAAAPAASDTIHLRPPTRYTVNCAITSRLVLTDHPLPCQPVTGR